MLKNTEFGLHMLHRFGITLTAIALTAAALPLPCAAQMRLSFDHPGLGLRQTPGFTLFGGARESMPGAVGAVESYGGVTYLLPRGWGSSLEAGYTPESVLAPRQYSLAGEVRTALSDYKALSVGIRYRVYDTDLGAPGDAPLANGYSLAPSLSAWSSIAPGYEVRFGYQHSALSLFGLALGRGMETYAAALEPTTPYPRQLSFTGLHWVTPSWAVSYDVLSGDLGSPGPLRLQGLGLRFGVRYRF